VIDVRDPSRPTLVHQLLMPAGLRSHKVQIVGDVMLVNYERLRGVEAGQGGLKVFDVSDPLDPREIAFLPYPGKGVHRMTYAEGPYAYMSATDDGWTDFVFVVVDLSDPAHPRECGRWWLPGMHAAGGETLDAAPGRRPRFHHALVRGDRAYCGWWDSGLVILDISDRTRPQLVSHLEFPHEASRATHTAFPLPGRELLVVTDEQGPASTNVQTDVRVVDISDERAPVVVGVFPRPDGDYASRPGRFGPHNVHEMRPGTFVSADTIHLTYFSAGLRIFDVSDPSAPAETAAYVPDTPAGLDRVQWNDVLVSADGLIYVSDRSGGGIYVLERTGS
jgi:hypothetical protein